MMRKIARAVALLSLVLLTGPSILYLAGKMSLDAVKLLMLAATVVWFVSASLWIWHGNTSDGK
jgi:hypothetical protein